MSIKYPENVIKIANILAADGYRAYAVGGCVRDSLMGRVPYDWDMTTDASPDRMLEIFDRAGVRTIPTGLKHGTLTVLLDGEGYECTTFRIDGSYTDSRHPDSVLFTSDIREDLRRRDFTVNAMAGDVLKDCDGDTVVDLFGGREDIENKIIRCVGDARERFSEDALRILRAVRFATVLGFEIEDKTRTAARELGEGLRAVSAERKKTELEKILLSPNADRGVKMLFSLGLTKYVHEDMRIPSISLSSLPARFPVRFAALMPDGVIPDLSFMKLSGIESTQIKRLCDRSLFCAEKTDKNARYLLSVFGSLAEDAALLHGDVELCKIIESERKNNPCVSISGLKVNGNDLISLGIAPRGIGKIMSELLAAVIDRPELNEKSVLCDMAKSIDVNGHM